MNLLDVSLVSVALISVIAGALRGFVKELTALAGWVLAVLLVIHCSVSLGERLPFDPGAGGVRTAVAAILIVLVCVLSASLLGRMLRAVLTAAKLGGADRALGALFGIARAGAVWLLAAVIIIHLGMAQRPFWKSSRLAPLIEAALRWMSPELVPSAPWLKVVPGV
jgi:membrane protein required for colicin V production